MGYRVAEISQRNRPAAVGIAPAAGRAKRRLKSGVPRAINSMKTQPATGNDLAILAGIGFRF